MLQQVFHDLVSRHTDDIALTTGLWQEITAAYSQPSRHYHDLHHLENMVQELEGCRHLLNDYHLVLFSVFYHDVVYDVLRHDNEEQSALFAAERLRTSGLTANDIAKCSAQILATKAHAISEDPDTNLFTDADLSILGKAQDTYASYCKQVRQEYHIYPDEVYIPGRRKVLQHFLAMDCIYKTSFFHSLYEESARRNMLQELEQLH